MRLSFHRHPLLVTTCALLLAGLPARAGAPDPLHAWAGGTDPAALERWVDLHLAAVRKDLDKLRAVKGKRTVENTLRPFDDAQNELALAGNETFMMFAVGKPAALRDKAQALNQKVSAEQTRLALDPTVYEALKAVPLPAKDPATRHYLERSLLEYRLAGVDRDAATRAKVQALQDRVSQLTLAYGRNIQDGVLKVQATQAELAGLPGDYVARHQPGPDGTFTLTTDPPDYYPVMDFASDAGLRKRMYLAYQNRAYPANRQVLMDILGARQELAGLLGFKSWADFATADLMIGNPGNIRALFDQVDQATRDAKAKEYATLLAYARQRDPALQAIPVSDSRYWTEQYRRATFGFDAQSVRPYFPYDQVEAGILGAAGKIFRVSFKPVRGATVWDPSVTVYDVLDRGAAVGRIYLDMHPREGKDKWFSSQGLVPGIKGRQKPEGMLICNFSGGVAGDPGLMQFDEVVTYFHEFGHLMHHILGSQNRWSGQGGFNVEGDFVEAPSQMLEEFFRDRAVLAPFARHYQTHETIPAALVDRMNAANAFGRGIWAQRQLYLAEVSLDFHDRPAAQVDPDALYRAAFDRYMPFGFLEGDHLYASFTHLTGYSSNYYTYVLDKVIALDFFAQFDKADPLEGSAPARYRAAVIDPGATRPAADLVKAFLGRPQNMEATRAWVEEQFKARK